MADDMSGGRRPPLIGELALGLAIFVYYLLVELWAADGRRSTADRNAMDLFDLERWLHLDIERTLNDWLAPRDTLSTLANYEYAFTYIASAAILIAWAYVKAPDAYRLARNSFAILNILAITCFAFYPVTPPRLLPEIGFVDTVSEGGTVGSWGSPLVAHANQLAAMPSLHVAWALWVSVVLARLSRGTLVQVVSAVHVALTVYVVVATANHYIIDAVAAIPFVWVSVFLADRWWERSRGRMPSPDAFFLYAETDDAPQHVGGVAVLRETGPDTPTLEQMRDLVHSELAHLPRFRQRLELGSGRQRPRWVDAPDLDWEWHVSERRVDAVDPDEGMAGLSGVVADLAAERMPRDRPMWRIVMVRGVGTGRSAMVILVHHCVADGIGTVVQALQLLRPRIELGQADATTPGALATAAATVAGLAQLATDGRPSTRLGPGSRSRGFGVAELDLATIRGVARDRGARVTDVLLCLTAEAVHRVHPDLARAVEGRLRVSVPLMVRAPDTAAEGNVTAAVMLDVPVGPMSPTERLDEIRRRSAPLRKPTRALASRFVMASALNVAPEAFLRWFARTVYGPAFFQAIVSNMPGPTDRLTLGGSEIATVVPILPLAPDVPLALGALSWADVLGLGLAVDASVLDADALAATMTDVLTELADGHHGADVSQTSARNSRARSRGESS